jgi:hypothetical protein
MAATNADRSILLRRPTVPLRFGQSPLPIYKIVASAELGLFRHWRRSSLAAGAVRNAG